MGACTNESMDIAIVNGCARPHVSQQLVMLYMGVCTDEPLDMAIVSHCCILLRSA